MFSFAGGSSLLKNTRQLSQRGWLHHFHDSKGCPGLGVLCWMGRWCWAQSGGCDFWFISFSMPVSRPSLFTSSFLGTRSSFWEQQLLWKELLLPWTALCPHIGRTLTADRPYGPSQLMIWFLNCLCLFLLLCSNKKWGK